MAAGSIPVANTEWGRLIVPMDDNPYDPRVLSRRFYRETLWLRSLLTGVAQELERMAAREQGQPDVLLGRAGTSGRVG